MSTTSESPTDDTPAWMVLKTTNKRDRKLRDVMVIHSRQEVQLTIYAGNNSVREREAVAAKVCKALNKARM